MEQLKHARGNEDVHSNPLESKYGKFLFCSIDQRVSCLFLLVHCNPVMICSSRSALLKLSSSSTCRSIETHIWYSPHYPVSWSVKLVHVSAQADDEYYFFMTTATYIKLGKIC